MNKITPERISEEIEAILPGVQKPGRYAGGELNQVVKDWRSIKTRVALVFPDIYDLGMSNLGLAILYDILNKRADVLAERVFSPWHDFEISIREAQIPLFSLETRHALNDFDIIGISLPYETLYTNVLNILDLGEVPVQTKERTENHPLVIAGGHAVYNPEPMHTFIDAFVIGEGEEVILEIVDAYQEWKRSGSPRSELLLKLSCIWGVYVPSLYEAAYHPDKTISAIRRVDKNKFQPVLKRFVPKLPPPNIMNKSREGLGLHIQGQWPNLSPPLGVEPLSGAPACKSRRNRRPSFPQTARALYEPSSSPTAPIDT